MAKVADVKLTWKKSASADVTRVVLTLNNNGTTTTTDLGPEVEEFVVEVKALAAVSFHLTSYDSEGNQSSSTIFNFTLGDLVAPLPPTSLGYVVIGVRDVPEPPPPPAP